MSEMPCIFCGKTALRKVGSRGYCKQHIPESYVEAAKEKRLQQSLHGLMVLDWRRRKDEEFRLKG